MHSSAADSSKTSLDTSKDVFDDKRMTADWVLCLIRRALTGATVCIYFDCVNCPISTSDAQNVQADRLGV